jgi:hypothetical protein
LFGVVVSYVSNVSRWKSLSRKKFIFLCIIDMTEIKEITPVETCHGKTYFPINVSPEPDLPPCWVCYFALNSEANTELIVLDEVYVHFDLQRLLHPQAQPLERHVSRPHSVSGLIFSTE